MRVQVWQPLYGRQADTSWLRLSRKQDRISSGVGALPTPSANPFRSSKEEHPPDKRKTLERYQAEGPIIPLDGVDRLHAWLKPRRCRCDSDSSGHSTSVNAKVLAHGHYRATGPSSRNGGRAQAPGASPATDARWPNASCPRSSVRSERHRAKVEVAGAIPAVDAILPLCLSSYRTSCVNSYGGRVQTLGASPTRGSILW